MENITITRIVDRLKKLPPDKLTVVYDFVFFLAERQPDLKKILEGSESYYTMLASEEVLSQEWNLPEEDETWCDL